MNCKLCRDEDSEEVDVEGAPRGLQRVTSRVNLVLECHVAFGDGSISNDCVNAAVLGDGRLKGEELGIPVGHIRLEPLNVAEFIIRRCTPVKVCNGGAFGGKKAHNG